MLFGADDEAEEEQKKKKSGNTSKEKRVVQAKEQNGVVAGASTSVGKKTKRVLKRIIRTKKSDGTFTSREIIITDPKEVISSLGKLISGQTISHHGSLFVYVFVFLAGDLPCAPWVMAVSLQG